MDEKILDVETKYYEDGKFNDSFVKAINNASELPAFVTSELKQIPSFKKVTPGQIGELSGAFNELIDALHKAGIIKKVTQ